jgi:hypothetical protein
MMLIDFPEELGGRRALKKILKRFSFLSKEMIPKFQMEAIQSNRDIGFDLTQYIHSKYIEKGQLTARFGWHQRKIPDDESLEFYSIYRHLRFASSQAIIREHILDSINKALNGPILNLGTKLVMRGIRSSVQIKSEYKTLHDGDLEFVELFKKTSI